MKSTIAADMIDAYSELASKWITVVSPAEIFFGRFLLARRTKFHLQAQSQFCAVGIRHPGDPGDPYKYVPPIFFSDLTAVCFNDFSLVERDGGAFFFEIFTNDMISCKKQRRPSFTTFLIDVRASLHQNSDRSSCGPGNCNAESTPVYVPPLGFWTRVHIIPFQYQSLNQEGLVVHGSQCKWRVVKSAALNVIRSGPHGQPE